MPKGILQKTLISSPDFFIKSFKNDTKNRKS